MAGDSEAEGAGEGANCRSRKQRKQQREMLQHGAQMGRWVLPTESGHRFREGGPPCNPDTLPRACTKPRAWILGTPTCTPCHSWKPPGPAPRAVLATGAAVSRSRKSFTPAEMPRETALLPADLGKGWIDRQTDRQAVWLLVKGHKECK